MSFFCFSPLMCGDTSLATKTAKYKERIFKDHTNCANPSCKLRQLFLSNGSRPGTPKKKSQEGLSLVAGSAATLATLASPVPLSQSSEPVASLLSSSAPATSFFSSPSKINLPASTHLPCRLF